MKRRECMTGGLTGAAAAYVPPHNFDRYDFGSGTGMQDRLNQGPFPADLYPSWNVVMALTPLEEMVHNYGMGLVTYLCDEKELRRPAGVTTEKRRRNSPSFPRYKPPYQGELEGRSAATWTIGTK